MWIFSRYGFYSATQSPTKLGHIQIRARLNSDLQRLKQRFPDLMGQAKIIETPEADYRWRTVVTPSKFTVLMMELSKDIDYGNFKNACAANGLDTHPHHRVWSIMHEEQRRELKHNFRRWDEDALPGLRTKDLGLIDDYYDQ